MNTPQTDALLVIIPKLERAINHLRKTHDYNAWIPIDRHCEGCAIILGLEESLAKAQHALKGKEQ